MTDLPPDTTTDGDAPVAGSARPAKPVFPLPPVVERLTTQHGYPRLEDPAAEPWRGDAGTWVVFLPGHGKGNGETADVAVILPELVRTVRPALTPAVAGPAVERALLARTGMMSLPALVFLRGDTLLGTIARVRDWQDYLERIAAILPGDAPAPIRLQ